ncbi:alpha-amylase family glycosyl hydrolase [Gorillibacterium sp. CAU 1737]|uniref:alpha-amylase family glycosyl hydrolase n=1 Tax=Gorillibacterium sp. CAU 1737 TaxID=3140362 RepID=UPI003260CAB3
MTQAYFNHQEGNRSSVPSFKWRRKMSAIGLVLLIVGTGLLSGCTKSEDNADPAASLKPSAATVASAPVGTQAPSENPAPTVVPSVAETHQQPSTAYYQIFVRSFYDSNDDGIGDLNGITEKLDYIKELGFRGIWLMPIMKSPSYHGYDVADYESVNPDYGTVEDLARLTQEAHKRDIKVILDFVVNHTSTEHPWFLDAAKGPSSKYRDWYIWAEDQKREPVGTSAASAGSPWHSVNGSHYLGIFWQGMPDLNLDHPDVRAELIKSAQFWLKQGVDGFRLDAAKHVYEDFSDQKGKPEIFAKNAEWWQVFRKGLDEVNPNAYLVGEVWDSAAASGPLLNKGLNGTFNFELASMLISSARTESASDFAGKLEPVYTYFDKTSEGKFLDATFLTNHDQNRVMNEVAQNVDHAKMAAGLLLTLPGNPFVYYGEEIGMRGTKPDEQIREPFLWYAGGTKGKGQAAWEPLQANVNPGTGWSAEEQLTDSNSLLARYRTLLHWRKENAALKNGGIARYDTGAKTVAGFWRTTPEERVLVLHNLSGKPQTVTVIGTGTRTNSTSAVLLYSTSDSVKLEAGKVELPPYTTVVLQ